MKGILILEITTSAPVDLIKDRQNIILKVGAAGMTWEPEIDQLHFMETEIPSVPVKAISGMPKAVNYPFNMGMHLGMSLVGEGD